MARQRRDAAIVGIHEYPLRVAPGVSAMQIKTDSILAALDDAGLSLRDVDVDEDFRMLTNIVGIDDPTQDMAIGQRVRVEFEQQDSGDYPIPVFRPI